MFSDQYIDKEENSKIMVSPAHTYIFVSKCIKSIRVLCFPVNFFVQYLSICPTAYSFNSRMLCSSGSWLIAFSWIRLMQKTQRWGSTLDWKMLRLILSFYFTGIHVVIFSSRSQITPCCQTQGVCQNSSECACKRVMKTPGTSPLFLICRCSICQLTLYPKSSGENTEYHQCVTALYVFDVKINKMLSAVLTSNLMWKMSHFSWSHHSLRPLSLSFNLL